MNLGFANPGLAWAALFALLPVLIHLLNRRRPRPLKFAALEFVLRSHKRNARRFRLRQLLLLLARMAVLGAVGFALGRPRLVKAGVVQAEAQGPSATAIVLDGSLSMRYRLHGETLFERARADALEALDALGPDAPSSVSLCVGPSGAAPAPSFERAAQRRLLEDAQPTYRTSDMTACIAAAARALGESPLAGKRVVVLTDLTAASLSLDAPPPTVPTAKGDVKPAIVLVDAARGAELPNVAVTEVTLEPAASAGTREYTATATIANAGTRAVSNLPVALKVNGRVVAKGFADVPARGTARKALSARLEPGFNEGDVEVTPDASAGELPDDDARAFALDVPRDVRVLVVDGAPNAIKYRDAAFFVEAALSPARTGGRLAPTLLDFDAAAARAGELAAFDVVFLVDTPAPAPPFASALKEFVRRGGGLFIAVGERVDPDAYNEALGDLLPQPLHLPKSVAENVAGSTDAAAHFSTVDWQHPILRVFNGADRESILSARTTRYLLLRPDPRGAARTLIGYDDGAPALVEARRGEGRVLLDTSTVDREWSDFAIRTSFLPVVQQLAGYLARALDERTGSLSVVGDSRTVKSLEGQRTIAVVAPGGARLTLGADGVLAALETPGVYRVRVAPVDAAGKAGPERDDPALAFAVGLEPRESDTRRVDAKELLARLGGEGNASVRGSANPGDDGRGKPLWTALLVLGVVAFFGEGLLLRR